MLRLRFLFLALLLAPAVTGGPAWLTISQLSERLQIPVKTLYDWRQRGFGPKSTKLGRGQGGHVRYKITAVEAWEAAQEQADSRVAS
jgi:predicted DNA-binding transcriptional regulator AlpA